MPREIDVVLFLSRERERTNQTKPTKLLVRACLLLYDVGAREEEA